MKMSHTITISFSSSKEEKYISLLPQIKSLLEDMPASVRDSQAGELDLIANLSNICAAMKYNMDNFFWVGFYFLKGDELIVGPYQGPLACTRIKITDGVCGASVRERKTIIVDDVNKFPGHIACSPDSKSEIVVPIFKNRDIFAVLDIDSDKYSNFDEIDKKYLEQLTELITEKIIPAGYPLGQAGIPS